MGSKEYFDDLVSKNKVVVFMKVSRRAAEAGAPPWPGWRGLGRGRHHARVGDPCHGLAGSGVSWRQS